MQDPTVYLNGVMTPLSEAKIPVLDRGFIFGDGVYEVIPVYAGRMFRPDEHMARLFRSLAAIGIPNPHDKAGWLAIIRQVIATAPDGDQMVYMQVTRGVAPRKHAFPAETIPTVFIMINPFPAPSAAVLEGGVSCVSMDDQRWLRCEIKSTSLLGNVLAAQNAAENEATESIQFRDGYLTEGSASNVWLVKDGALFGPQKNNLILEGIRYGLMEELCAAQGVPLQSRRITRAEVLTADEIMLTSASREVVAVTTLDGQPVGNGKPGPLWRKLYAAYQATKQAS
jgi:D-alanine transaminase